MNTVLTPDEQQRISELAYRHWETRGRPDGDHLQDWLTAEQEFGRNQAAEARRAQLSDTDASLDASFPASDPPASHIPDAPPANAEAKWQLAAKQGRDIPRKRKDA